MKVFISQPMRDKTNEEIKKERAAAIEYVKKETGEDAEAIDSFFEEVPHKAKPLWCLGKAIQLLGTADVAVFIGEWGKYRGCKIEHAVCKEYGIKALYAPRCLHAKEG